MTLREAICSTIELLRSTFPEDADVKKIVRVLERKAERDRARSEKSLLFSRYCFCGDRREPKALVCRLCYPHIPMELWIALHAGRGTKRKAAGRKIKLICETRSRVETEAA